jgi:hypothetical protein
MCHFFWYYYFSVKNATPLILPSHSSLGVVWFKSAIKI